MNYPITCSEREDELFEKEVDFRMKEMISLPLGEALEKLSPNSSHMIMKMITTVLHEMPLDKIYDFVDPFTVSDIEEFILSDVEDMILAERV